jgi:hypothetical protein
VRLLAALLALLVFAQPARAVDVGTALVLLVDVSGSVDDGEYALQRDGIAQAFIDPKVVKAIWNQPFGRMMVTVVEWSDTARQVVPWTLIDGADSAAAFAGLVAATSRSSRGSTALGEALVFAGGLLPACGCAAQRRVIDVSGDGVNNAGAVAPTAARDLLVSDGAVINGLPITGDGSDLGLLAHYEQEVKGGDGAFVIEANGFEDFARALRQKLVLEIALFRP